MSSLRSTSSMPRTSETTPPSSRATEAREGKPHFTTTPKTPAADTVSADLVYSQLAARDAAGTGEAAS